MSEFLVYFPTIANFIGTIVALVWFFARMSEKISLLNQKVDLKFEEIGKDVKEIKDNHLQHLDQKFDKLADCLNNHLQNHNK